MSIISTREPLARLPEPASRRPRSLRWRIAAGPLVALAILLVGALLNVSADRRASTADDRAGTAIAQISPQVEGRVLRAHLGPDQPAQAGDALVEIDR